MRSRALSGFLGLVLAGLAAGAGCGGKSSQQVNASGAAGGSGGARGGTGGTAGGGGTSGATGGAGASGTGNGSAGTGGSSGASGAEAGGASGAGGATGGVGASGASAGGAGSAGRLAGGMAGMFTAECATAEDCTLQSDCCGCKAVPTDGREPCLLACVKDPCPEMGITADEVACVYGRCVLSRACDGRATCPALPEECPEGTLPSVVDGCWGPCLPPTECVRVASCGDCGSRFCVEFQGMASTFHCVDRVAPCDRENYCECLGVCGECTEADDSVSCPCGGC